MSPTCPQRNILILIADDLGREQMSCYGCKALTTPHLDALAASGTIFDCAFTSTASCSGSRTVIYTGLHTHESGSYGLTHGRNGFRTFEDVETAPLLFNKLDYKTGILGKVHVGPAELYPWQTRWESETRNVAEVADRAEAFFRASIDESRPFFLTVGFVDPHRQLSKRAGFGNVEGNHDSRLHDRLFRPDEVAVPSYLSDLPEVRLELAEYYRAIHRMDQGVGLILAALQKCGLAQDTLVLFLSDNGPPFINSKTTLYEAGVRLPFLLRIPGKGMGVTNSNLISYTDIVPTLLNWAGKPDSGKQGSRMVQRRGRSILPIVDRASPVAGWDFVFGSHTFHEVTNYWPTRYMRNRRYKYHRNICWKLDFPFAMDLYASLSFEGMRNSATELQPAMIGRRRLKDYICRPPEELYDLENDSDEVVDLARDPAYAETLASMRAALEHWQIVSKDLWLWRDGAPVVRYIASDYAREGLRIPDRFDFDADRPATTEVPVVDLLGSKASDSRL
jgi:N-sulfoglucosamine sulfohydrolase